KNVYNVDPGEVFWAASDVGWVVGHSYICYGPLIAGNTTIVFEGKPVGTPDAGTFWRVISEHDVKSFFTAPTAFRAVKREDPTGALVKDYDLSGLRSVFLAGERADPDTIQWAETQLGVPVIDHWWQTETLWNAEERFKKSYLNTFPGYYETGDAGYKDEDGYLYIMARTDDVINVAGHRLSTGAMEEVLASHPDVAECAVIGVGDDLKGQIPLGFLCLNAGSTRDNAEVVAECVKLVRDQIGPVAAFKAAVVVDRLPKTRSGKILRGTMVSIADGKEFKMPATIDDPAILDEIRDALEGLGYAKA
ncbi:MAG: AMP-binding protein, partial [Maritimibacter sp.]